MGNANLIKKVYFPRLVIPIAGVFGGIDRLRARLRRAAGDDAGLRHRADAQHPLAAAVLPAGAGHRLGVGLWLSAINVQYRDVRYIVPFLMQIWMFATPIAYPSSLLPEPWRTLYGLNPMAGVVEGFRWALLGSEQAGRDRAGVRAGGGWRCWSAGLYYFRRMEKTFADVV